MIKHTVKYYDFEDNEVERDFWFNLNEGDIALIQMSKKQGFFEMLEIAEQNEDPTVVAEAFQKILVGAVGRREGEEFIKDDAARNRLIYTNAYGALIVWMLANPLEARALINGMLPKRAQDELVNPKDELVKKMKERLDEKIAQIEPEPAVEDEGVKQDETQWIPDDVPAETQATPDFSTMTPEEFTAWQATQA